MCIRDRLITTVHAEENRLPVSIDEVPANLQNAFIAVEDNRFYEHHGVDPVSYTHLVADEVIDYLNARGEKVGIIKIRLYRPWVSASLLKAVSYTHLPKGQLHKFVQLPFSFITTLPYR